MNKTELIAAVAEDVGVGKKDTEQVLNAFFSTVQETLKQNDKVQILALAALKCVSVPPARAATRTPARRSRSPRQRCLRSNLKRV